MDAADLEPCLDLFEAVAAERRWLASEPPVDRRELRARWQDLLAHGPGTLLVADGDGAPLGIAALTGRGEVELGMLVGAPHRGRGVGRALLEAAVGWARGAGASRVVLHVFPHNAAARALYARAGFTEAGMLSRAYVRRGGEAWDAIRMELPLDAGPPAR
jgi:RimJ/RimL family protein N-acetyltransferase